LFVIDASHVSFLYVSFLKFLRSKICFLQVEDLIFPP